MKNRIFYCGYILIVILASLSNTKYTSCKNKFKDEDFIYCTKYGASAPGIVESSFKARFTSTYKKQDEKIGIEVGVYNE